MGLTNIKLSIFKYIQNLIFILIAYYPMIPIGVYQITIKPLRETTRFYSTVIFIEKSNVFLWQDGQKLPVGYRVKLPYLNLSRYSGCSD
jgi:hypothetical protein